MEENVSLLKFEAEGVIANVLTITVVNAVNYTRGNRLLAVNHGLIAKRVECECKHQYGITESLVHLEKFV